MSALFTPDMSLAGVFLLVWIVLRIFERDTPASTQEKAYRAALFATDQALRVVEKRHRRHARYALSDRKDAMARCYWQASVWQWWLFHARANRCKTDAQLNRYVTLAEQHWHGKSLP